MLDFLQSRTFITHVTGLLALLGTAWSMPNSPLLSLAVALLTGVTQASHAYQNVKGKANIDSGDLSTLITSPGLYNAAGTAQVEAHPIPTSSANPIPPAPYTGGPST